MSHTQAHRTLVLLNTIESRIAVDPAAFVKFVQILESEPHLNDLADLLIRDYNGKIEYCTARPSTL